MNKHKILRIINGFLLAGICAMLIWGCFTKLEVWRTSLPEDDIQIDLDSIYLTKSGVQVDFGEVLIGTHEENRKLIVSTQEATVSVELTDRLVKKLDWDIFTKSQKVTYAGTGYFVVDLDNLKKEDIIVDQKEKTITIQIDHAYLQAIEIDPNKIIIDKVKQSLLARGDIELSLNDYNAIEKEIRSRLEAAFDTVKNGQEADSIALQMVKDVYSPIIKAIDSSYDLIVAFK